MTQSDLEYIKDAFSQIIDDLAGNPDWNDAASAVASNIGTLEKLLEKRVVELPNDLEEAALKAYPEDIQLFAESQEVPGKWLPVDENAQLRSGYKQGYKQAEKDLALTWEDIRKIVVISEDVFEEGNNLLEEEYYEEVLKRFKETKK